MSLYFSWRHGMLFIAVAGGWHHNVFAIAAGFLVIILAWVRGVLRPAASG